MILSAEQMRAATGGILHQTASPGKITTDTRKIHGSEWFIPLIGERFDAHNFLKKAADLGCIGTIASRVPDGWDRGWIEVPDTLMALQNIAQYFREQYSGTVIGITGSAGKTTLRVMILNIAKELGTAHGTSGNFNNHIGLPLTISAAKGDEKHWVLEMGMNHFGEIDLLQKISNPDIRIITNVGAAHTEGVGSIEGVAKAKSEIFQGAQPNDVCCINIDDAYINKMKLPDGVRSIRYGHHPTADVQIQEIQINPETLSSSATIKWPDDRRTTLIIPSPARHMAHNAVAAATVGYVIGASPEQIKRGLAAYQPTGSRLRLRRFQQNILVVDDAYNANPLSMSASIELMSQLSGRKIICLGDMLELGPDEVAIHKSILIQAQKIEGALIATAGPLFARAATDFKNMIVAETSRELGKTLRTLVREGDRLLLKGSRGLKMEHCLESLALKEQP